MSFTLNVTLPTLHDFQAKAIYIRLISVNLTSGSRLVSYEQYNWNGSQCSVDAYFTQINQRPTIGILLEYEVTATYVRNTGSNVGTYFELASLKPTASFTGVGMSGEYMPLETLLPDLERIRTALLDPTTGWMPTMNTNLQTVAANTATANSWLNLLNSKAQTQINNQGTQISNQQTLISNQQIQISNQQTQISQLQQIVDYVNSTVAANGVDQANQDFIQNAGALESGQDVLEGAADASLAAVDWNKINIIDTYSQSVNFWMLLVNRLPDALGALWSVLIFALILSFVLFIVRIRR